MPFITPYLFPGSSLEGQACINVVTSLLPFGEQNFFKGTLAKCMEIIWKGGIFQLSGSGAYQVVDIAFGVDRGFTEEISGSVTFGSVRAMSSLLCLDSSYGIDSDNVNLTATVTDRFGTTTNSIGARVGILDVPARMGDDYYLRMHYQSLPRVNVTAAAGATQSGTLNVFGYEIPVYSTYFSFTSDYFSQNTASYSYTLETIEENIPR